MDSVGLFVALCWLATFVTTLVLQVLVYRELKFYIRGLLSTLSSGKIGPSTLASVLAVLGETASNRRLQRVALELALQSKQLQNITQLKPDLQAAVIKVVKIHLPLSYLNAVLEVKPTVLPMRHTPLVHASTGFLSWLLDLNDLGMSTIVVCSIPDPFPP
jgi:hypothetical protein